MEMLIIKKGSYKIRQIHVDYIIDLIKRKPLITLNDILGYFHKKYKDITLSKTHLSNIIKYANLTYKQVQITHRPDTRYNKPINYDEEYKKFYSVLLQGLNPNIEERITSENFYTEMMKVLK